MDFSVDHHIHNIVTKSREVMRRHDPIDPKQAARTQLPEIPSNVEEAMHHIQAVAAETAGLMDHSTDYQVLLAANAQARQGDNSFHGDVGAWLDNQLSDGEKPPTQLPNNYSNFAHG